jgi:hypothetical protein
MAISITNDKFSFLNGGSGSVDIDVQTLPLDKPLDPNAGALFSAKFNVQGSPAFSFGPAADLKVNISANTTASLTPFFSENQQLTNHGLGKFFDANPHKLIVALDIAAKAAAGADLTFKYSSLSANASLEAGADGEYFYSRAYDTSKLLLDIVTDLVSSIRPPSSVAEPLQPGEVIYLEYGGYLNFGLGVSAGYEMKGSHSIALGNLLLSESYSLSLLGKLALAARVAGNFSIQLRAGDADPSWIHVSVQKKHSSEFSFAADVKVGLTDESQNLPGSAQDFLGAILGVNAKNWLNFAQQILDSNTPDKLKNSLDSLAEHFVSQFVDKSFDALSQTDFKRIIDTANNVVQSYQKLDTTAINIFDKFFKDGEPAIINALQQLRHLASLDQLAQKYTDSSLIKFIEELTGGDPLSWILDEADIKDPAGDSLTKPILDIFNGRVEDALSLLQDDAHSLIKKYITFAKTQFGLDSFFNRLGGITTFDGLKQKADAVLNSFIERIIGRTIDGFDKGALGKILDRLQKINKFENDLFAQIKQALNQTTTLALHAEYSRAAESDILLEIEINPATAKGIAVLRDSCRGNFTGVLAAPITQDYRILGGVLLDQLTKSSKLTFNIAGWHTNFHYSSVETILTETQQRIVPGDNGVVTVFTSLSVKATEDIEKGHQELHGTFLLSALGRSSLRQGSLDPKTERYIVDTLEGMSASYDLLLKDQKAEQNRVRDLLQLAQDLKLTEAVPEKVLPLLEKEKTGSKEDFGSVSAEYHVRFADEAVKQFFLTNIDPNMIRQTMRKVTLASSIGTGLEDLAWAYFTDAVFQAREQDPVNFINVAVSKPFDVADSPFPSIKSPGTVTIPRLQLFTLRDFYNHEDDLVNAIQRLHQMTSQPVSPKAFVDAMGDFAGSFGFIAAGQRTNAIFSVFDKLLAFVPTAGQVRASSLQLTSAINEPRTKVFLQVQ